MTDYDSILTHPVLSPLAQTEFYAEGEGLADRTQACALRPENITAQGWLVVVMLIVLCLLSALIIRNRHYLTYRIKEFFTSGRHFSDMPMLPAISDVPQNLFMMLAGSLGVAVLAESQLTDDLYLRHYYLTSQWVTLILGVGTMLGMLVKIVLYETIGWTFFRSQENRYWMSSYTFLTAVFSVLVYLISVLFVFTEMTLFYVSICLITLLIIYEILLFSKLLSNFHVKRYGNVLFFLYFCSVELMPIAMLWHFFERLNTH